MFKSVFIAVLLSLSAHLWADDSEQPSFAFDHVALSVADVDTSVVFYEALFGMTNITDREPIDGVRWLSMQGGGEMHLLAIVDGDVVTNQAVHLAVDEQDRIHGRRVHDLAQYGTRRNRSGRWYAADLRSGS
jgi:catechol 2,3-dioxygenase-like lactoylglutathione lyase family enzyme